MGGTGAVHSGTTADSRARGRAGIAGAGLPEHRQRSAAALGRLLCPHFHGTAWGLTWCKYSLLRNFLQGFTRLSGLKVAVMLQQFTQSRPAYRYLYRAFRGHCSCFQSNALRVLSCCVIFEATACRLSCVWVACRASRRWTCTRSLRWIGSAVTFPSCLSCMACSLE